MVDARRVLAKHGRIVTRPLLPFAVLFMVPALVWAQVSPNTPGPGAPAAPPFTLEAADVRFSSEGQRIEAVGDPLVRIVGEQGTVTAPRLSYDITNDRLLAEGGVVFTDPEGTTLRSETLELTGDLKTGALTEISIALPELGEVLVAQAASRDGDIFRLQDLTYSPCESCAGEAKAWQVKAAEAEFDQAAGTMTYRHARFEVAGVPVAYVPWFRHPLGTEEPRSGLLAPSFGRSEDLGDQLWLGGYVWSPAENADYTLKTRLMSERGAMLMAERRQVGQRFTTELRGSWLNDQGLATTQGQERGHLAAEGVYNFTPSTRLGLNAETVSDDGYLNQFFNRNDAYLASTLFAESGSSQRYLGAKLVHFEDLNPTRRSAATAQVLPQLTYAEWWALGPQGGQLDLQADLLALHRSSGTDTHRLASRAAYSLPVALEDGSRLTLGATARADSYHISGPNSGNGVLSRFLPEATLDWEKPYLSPGGNHQLVPRVLLAASPRGGTISNKIPNEDSVAYELDTANLFEPSRFAGIDRVETGPRLVYGLENRWGDPDNTKYRLFLGQSLRRYDDASLPVGGGAATNVSDWVGEAEASPAAWFSGEARWRLDNATFNLRRIDTSLRLGEKEGAHLITTYSFLDNTTDNLAAQFTLPLHENWELNGRTRHDFGTDTVLEAEAGLTWFRDCYALEFVARRKGFRNTNLTPGTEYLVNIQLLTLGRSADLR